MNPFRSLPLALLLRLDLSDFLPMGRHKQCRPRLARLATLVAAFALCAAGAQAATLTVNTTADSSDSSGSCGSGTCSLRDAISQANAASAGDTINFSVSGTITLTSALPAITQNLTIEGPGANQLTVSGAGFAIFQVGPGANVTISGITVAGGSGAISVNASATVTVQNCAFTGSTATSGGAIVNAGSLSVYSSTFSGNSAQQGGALFNASGATMTVANDTFTQNSASAGGGAIQNAGTLTAINNTFYADAAPGSSGGAIFNASGSSVVLTANNNVFANNTASTSGAGIYNTTGDTANANFNVYYKNLTGGSEDDCNGCTTNASPTATTANPLTLPLGNYGGPTQTFLPVPGSAAICAGSASLASAASLITDQRGFAMNPTYNPCTAGLVDAGAVQTNYIQVQNSGDAGAGAGDCPGANCTLRDAIALAGSAGDIDFASGITTVNLANTNGGLTLDAAMGIEIVGPGANALTVNGNGSSTVPLSVFTVNSGTQAMLYGITVTGGNAGGSITNEGGGVNDFGTLLLAESAIANNVAAGTGGGVNNSGALTVMDSTISGNSAVGNGGGIYNGGTGSIASVTESTIYGNSAGASGVGGGIYNAEAMAVTGSTIWGNSNTGGTGGIFSGGTLTLANSIVANNSGASGFANVNGSFTGSGDVIGGGDSTDTANAGGTGAPITMSGLQLNGANDTVPTLIPLPGGTSGNPVICAGSASNIASGITSDERGYAVANTTYTGFSTASPCVDAGAVQTDYAMSFTASPTPATLTVDQGFGAEVTLDENGAPFAEASVSIPVTTKSGTLYGSGVVSGIASENTVAGVATFVGLTATFGSGNMLTSTLSLNDGLTTPLSLTASSSSFDVNPASTSMSLTSSSASPAVNQSVTFTATVSAPAGAAVPLTGNVTFTDNGSAINNGSSCGTAGVVAVTWNAATATGTANCTTSSLAGGSHAIVAAYNKDNSDASYLGSNNNVSESVGLVATTVAVPTLVSPASPMVGQVVTVSAMVSITGAVTVPFSGNMTFFDNGTAISGCGQIPANTTTGVAQCQIPAGLGANSYLITAQYNVNGADKSYQESAASGAYSLTIGKATINISVSSSLQPSAVNQPVTFTANLPLPVGGLPLTGETVAFMDNGNSIGCAAQPITQVAGTTNWVATCSYAALTASGSPHTIAVTYNGDTNFSLSTGTASQTVNKASSTLVLSSNQNPSNVNQSVTFTATISPAGSSVPLSGSAAVSFTETPAGGSASPITCAPAAWNATTGVASCTVSSLTPGSYTISAAYSGDPNYNFVSGGSNSLTQTVTTGTSSGITFTTSSSTSTVNTSVTFTETITATVPSGSSTAPNGMVNFTDSISGSTICKNVPVSVTPKPSSNGGTYTAVAACSYAGLSSALATAPHIITAIYGSDTNFSFANQALAQTVNPAATSSVSVLGTDSTTTHVPAFTSDFGDTVTFVATVAPSSSSPIGLTGAVTFAGVSGCVNVPVVVSASGQGQATCTTAALLDGSSQTIAASYSSDPNFTSAAGSTAWNVQEFLISVSGVPTSGHLGVLVTQGTTSAQSSTKPPADPFFQSTPAAVQPASYGNYSSSAVTVTCASTSIGAPACLPNGSSSAPLQIAAGNVVQQSINLTIDASGAGVSPGTYTFTVTANDTTTGLTRLTTFPVTVRPAVMGSSALNVVSGATSNNSVGVSFVLPQGKTLSSPACVQVVGTGITSAEAPDALGIACSFSPTSLGSSTSTGSQTVTATVTVTTNNTIAAVKPMDVGYRRPLLLVAGFLLPLFGLIGIRRGRKSLGATLFRNIAIAAVAIAGFQTLGCGGSYNSSSTAVSGGTTPPGTYYLLVQGTGSDGNNYQAVLQVNVNL